MNGLLPPAVQKALTPYAGPSPTVTPLTGGEVNHAALAEGQGERLVVKWQPGAPEGLFAAEADGLARLGAAHALRVPSVIDFDDAADPPWLALEYLAPAPPRSARVFAQAFGEGLAALHRDHPAPGGCFGLEIDNYLGAQPQRNTPMSSWPLFYRDRRLLPQIAHARSLGRLPPVRERLLEQVIGQMETLLEDFSPRPALIHGDLWSGNFLSLGDVPALIDPAVYYAEREVELAYIDLFGGFPDGFHAAYQSAFPLDPGYQRRRPLHQLYPLLIHLNHFGEAYGPRLDEACRRYS